ncbi:hypothetical protein MTER_19020 [Mycolicibacter terrae]|uniref:Uncharacterized protein n=1 Tax=Mycolicibacter terrae TaxID=1788 RepID=A0AAD1HXK3_9MYCO|nr:hypothetical protein [Mycolicibacter terrae]ORW96839.1 hypothetical protein AWC28_09705 [Mycolicibacter terrae]BBX22491.1 hypothetical protein MTER_19020 [Mycolicibacter terrae]SNV74891.1 Uncharacterised protein [Mycolicibacter terrae]
MWCPSVSLSVWANAWLAGQAAPDDLLDALSAWAPVQSVAAYDAISIGEAGWAWSGGQDGGTASLLQVVRGAAVPGAGSCIQPVFPVPGDVRGLPAATVFAREAILAGEAVLIGAPDSVSRIGLVPAFSDDTDICDDDAFPADTDGLVTELSWTMHALPATVPVEHHDLGEAEYALRAAVRTAADTLAVTGSRWAGQLGDDPRLLVEQLVDSQRHHRIPDHAPVRAVRILETAAHVDAIITVSSGLTVGAQSSAEVQRATDAVRPLAAVVRSSRSAAVTAILHSAWRA